MGRSSPTAVPQATPRATPLAERTLAAEIRFRGEGSLRCPGSSKEELASPFLMESKAFITTGGSLIRRIFFCFFSLGTIVRPFTREPNFLNFQTLLFFVFQKAPRRARAAVGKLVCARDLLGGRARALARLLVLARRHRGGNRSCLRAAGLTAAGRVWQLVCSLRPAVRSCGAARAAMLARAPPGSPPGDGLSARRWHTELGASAPVGSTTVQLLELRQCAVALWPLQIQQRS